MPDVDELIVGPIVGPTSDLPESSLGFTPDGVAWDYAIGGFPFVDAASDDRPYARETAEFRKEQFDSSRKVGDQSLTGYWTRGQLSFHRGAGINFYEVVDGDAVIDRFNDSRNVDTWTPGEVTVKAPHSLASTDIVSDALLFHTGFATLDAITGEINLRDFDASVDTALPSSDTNPFASMTTDGVNLWAINDDKIEVCAPGGSFTVSWTCSTGALMQIFWAKSRLWVVDTSGEWWTLSTAGGTFAPGDANSLWKSGQTGPWWALVDAPNGVYISVANTVYLSTWSTSTADVSVPSSVASVGAHEAIYNLGFYLGHLLILSDKAARMGVVRDSQVVLGDKFCTGATFRPNNRLAYRDSLFLVAGTGSDGATMLYEFNPLEQTTDLVPAWAPVRDVDPDTSNNTGALVFPDGRVMTFSENGGIKIDDADIGDATGYVTTAFHRFGTLELKDFRTLSVKIAGTAGSVGVEVVHGDGSLSSVVTLTSGNFADNEADLRLSSTTDAIGLKFTLIAEDGVSPRLLGYQLRAVPAPKRQRMIQIPLMCFDVERVGSVTRGHKGWAWERLSALEDMEAASGVVRFQDFATGEVGQVVVENVAFQRRTPVNSAKNGRGGFLVVTLRKVA